MLHPDTQTLACEPLLNAVLVMYQEVFSYVTVMLSEDKPERDRMGGPMQMIKVYDVVERN